jgi:hypothetical protein
MIGGSNNKINNARCAITGLSMLRKPVRKEE